MSSAGSVGPGGVEPSLWLGVLFRFNETASDDFDSNFNSMTKKDGPQFIPLLLVSGPYYGPVVRFVGFS